MKKNNLVLRSVLIVIILFMFSTSFYSQSKSGMSFYSGGHDSLLFDGANISSIADDDPEECGIKVDQVRGKVTGTRIIRSVAHVCDSTEIITEYKKEQIQVGDKLKPGDEITTESDAGAVITLVDGKRMWIKEHTTITIGDGDKYCRDIFIPVKVKKGGELFIDARLGDRNRVLEINSDRSKVYFKGTVVTIISQDGDENMDIVKTYEGVVEVYVNSKNSEGAADKIAKLNDDLQNNRITVQEYTSRMTELTSELSKIKVTLNAGYKCTIDSNGKMTDPEAFNIGDEPNFKE
jgi:hypothetical protein